MVSHKALVAAAVAFFLSPPALAGMYPKNSPVLQVDAKSYDKLIAKSNHTSIVEFYAPWCGHCQNLKPAYEKAAKNLAGLAKVAAVDCDDDANKPLCGQMGVQGFPTLKIVRPGKKPGKPVVEDYKGARSAKAIVDAVVEKIPNHVKRVGDKDIDSFLKEGNDTAKAILFTEKGTTSALLRALAVDFLGSVQVAQIRDKEKKAVEVFGVSKFPTLVLLPGGDKEALVYSGELKKEPMVEFLAQIAAPNPDPAPGKAKADKKAKKEPKKEETETSEEKVVIPNPDEPVEVTDSGPRIEMLVTEDKLQKECFTTKSHNCILALLPSRTDATEPLPEHAQTALASLTEVIKKHTKGGHRLFPVYSAPINNEGSVKLRKELSLKEGDIELIVTNSKKGWWKHYSNSDFSQKHIEDWIDAIKMGEGKKEKLPKGIVVEAQEEDVKEDKEQQPIKIQVEEILEEEKTAPEHGEL
ncbi:putative pdi related protein a protein [Neofusicoccum parvum]|uniref:protein disulfide-isomerase n=1 Tax=Botryosphaeria parva (strain UCR-NP2) TaxID=1287680 RepID=R1EZD0_BOTPV|nr:putative pdi related protein a protein [Neofusicoccum parvum UCRNP2]GME33939.1 putative pdi related protein a protein [Neofusicoccum parvum]